MLKLLGFVCKAKKLISGTDIVLEGIRNKKVKLVILASDAGVNTTKMITDKTKYYEVPLLVKFSGSELSKAIGKQNRFVIGITDMGFAKKLLEMGDQDGK